MNRPVGVTILAVVAFFFAGFIALGALFSFLGGAIASHLTTSGALKVLAGVGGAIIGVILLGVAVIYLVDGIGLLKLANWARILTIILVGISVLHVLFRWARFGMFFHPVMLIWSAIILVIDIWILVYLFKPHVKQAFGAK